MSKKIVICGDSFNIGIGCKDLKNEPYGQLLSNRLARPITNLAKGSSTNLSIYLQVKHAVDVISREQEGIEYVIYSNTSYDRVEWFPENLSRTTTDLTLYDVNYHQYPPYGSGTYISMLDHPMKNEQKYKGKMFTDNIMGIIDFWENFASKNITMQYYQRFNDEPKDRIKTIYDWGTTIMDYSITRLQGISLMVLAHILLENAGIKHLLLTDEPEEYIKYIPSKNVVPVDWGKLSKDYPDDLPSLHTSLHGHKIVYNTIVNKLIDNGWEAI